MNYWRDELDGSAIVLDVIEHGYVLPLKTKPTPFVGENQASVLANRVFGRNCRRVDGGWVCPAG